MNAEKLRSIGQSLIAVADGHSNLDDTLRELFENLPDRIRGLIYDKIKSISSHQLVTESLVHRGSTDKHDEHISRNEHDGHGAESNERADGDGDTSQDERCLTTCEAPLPTAAPPSGALVGIEEKSQGEDLFEVQPGHSKFLDHWAKWPETFFDKDPSTNLSVGIYQFVIDIENSQDLNAIKLRYTFRQLYLSRESWARYQTDEFNKTLANDYTKSQESTIRTWLKEGHLYDLLCRRFGIGCLFCDVVSRPDARKLSLPTEKKPKRLAYEKLLRDLDRRKLGDVSEKYKPAADKIASYMEEKQIAAGLLRVTKRAADELSRDPRETRSKKVCRRTGPDQPSITQDDLTCDTGHVSTGPGTGRVADDGRNDGSGPQNAAVVIRDDQLRTPSPQPTSRNRLHESLEQNVIPSNPKTTAATMSTTLTPSPASNTDAETQPGRENTLSDRLQTESQNPDAVSSALSSSSNSLPADGPPRSGHTASSHPNSEIPQEQPPFLQSPSHTDISSVSAPMPDKFNSMPSQQQSSHIQQQHSQFHGDDLQTSQQSKIIGHMDMSEAVASVSTPVPEPRYFESSQNINEKSAGQESAPILAQGEEDQQPGSSHSELQNRDWDIEAGAEHAGIPDTCPQADNTRTYNLLNESQDSRSATESCQSGYCPSPATNDDAVVNAGRHLRRSPTERGRTDDESTSPLLPNDVHDQTKRFSSQQRAELSSSERTTTNSGPTGHPTSSLVESRQEDTSPNVGNAYHWQTESTSNTSFSWNQLPDQNSQAHSMSLESSACLQGQRPSAPDSTQAEMLLTTTDSGLGFHGSDVMGNYAHNASLCSLENFDQPVLQQPGTQYQEASPQRLQSPSRTTILGTARLPQAEVNNGMKANDNLASVGDSRGHGSPQQMDPNMFWNMVVTSEFGYGCWGEYGDFDVSKPGLPSLET
ncbi:hypothetical protein Forpi1262_v015389 [Fusarium oxysporum f. sp. raphani]|nr:hypothetical protein Forpi1262_v015389 [Fusarium oxysporum f. sp. raphani]